MKKLLVILCYLLITSCIGWKEYSSITWKSNHLINRYIEVDNISCAAIDTPNAYIVIRFLGDNIYPSPELYNEVMKWKVVGEGDETFPFCKPVYYGNESYVDTFNKLAQKNGDGGFAFKYTYWVLGEDAKKGTLEGFNDIESEVLTAITGRITNLEISSDMEFDSEHPMGSSLMDIAYLDFCSYAPILRSKEYSNPKISKRFEELSSEDFKIIGATIHLSFTSKPTTSNIHNMTITITFDDGKVFSETVKLEFKE